MKKVFSVALGLAALALAVAFNFGANDAHAQVQGQTDLGGTTCDSGQAAEWNLTSYDIDYGQATATQFANGATDVNGNATKSGASAVVLTDYCGIYTYDIDMTFETMTGADNGDTIPNSNHNTTYTSFVDSVGNLESSTEVDGNPNADAPWAGNTNPDVISRTAASGAVGVANLTLEHTLDIPAGTDFDSSYDGTWTLTRTVN